ncbi:hypothetical protein [Chitinimonas sp.]|uniref:hypothetical protein n=1 Tax=Chitinimonas sp. TaxID=1934313 RepID=UPI0035B24FED
MTFRQSFLICILMLSIISCKKVHLDDPPPPSSPGPGQGVWIASVEAFGKKHVIKIENTQNHGVFAAKAIFKSGFNLSESEVRFIDSNTRHLLAVPWNGRDLASGVSLYTWEKAGNDLYISPIDPANQDAACQQTGNESYMCQLNDLSAGASSASNATTPGGILFSRVQ